MTSIYDTHRPAAGEGAGLYLKIQDGESVKLRIASEPAIFESLNDRDGEKTLSTRYAWLVWNQETNQAQILQQGVRFFRSLAALAQDEEWGDPQEYDIRITRQGSGTDTTYNVTPSANRASLSPDAKQAIDKINLIEKVEASPFSQRVMWLSAWDEMASQSETSGHDDEIAVLETAGKAKARATADKAGKKPDVVIEDIGDEPVDLSNIPW